MNLFEYQNKITLDPSLEGLEDFLEEIWSRRDKSSYYQQTRDEKDESQRFIQFLRKNGEIKSNKYVGVIHFGGKKINLLPKIFFNPSKEYNDNEISQIHNHVLWWLSYCRKIKFPNYQTNLGTSKNDFFEVIIYLFAKYTRELLNSSLYQQYEEVSHELSFVKGRINTNTYITENISKARWQKLNCTYDAFVFDNEFNRIIKHVCSMLYKVTSDNQNKKYLREILFILDDVTDQRATAEQCSKISFNPLFENFGVVRDYCQLFLSNSISFDYKNDLRLFAFLLPMEYVFEDFIFGFISNELSDIKVKSQRKDTFLDESSIFNIQPDLWIETPTKSIIADTKYKLVYSDENDPKRGISQNDLYQMVSYAVRFNVDLINLFYPNTVLKDQFEVSTLEIKDKLADDKIVRIKAYQLPVINKEILNGESDANVTLSERFLQTKENLVKVLREILD
jgi:5-methylcytosine-specific restriction enzyme subunit McrC